MSESAVLSLCPHAAADLVQATPANQLRPIQLSCGGVCGDADAAVAKIAEEVRRQGIAYPSIKTLLSERQARECIAVLRAASLLDNLVSSERGRDFGKRMRAYRASALPAPRKYPAIVFPRFYQNLPGDPLFYHFLIHFFQESSIIRCAKPKRLAPGAWEKETPQWVWENNASAIIRDCVKWNRGLISVENLRKSVNFMGTQVSNFPVAVTAVLVEMFAARRVTDMCMGWGDRLLGALVKDVEFFQGTDPNPELADGYREIIRFANRGSEVLLDSRPAEDKPDWVPGSDLVLLSPPYWQLEMYRGEEQSTSRYSTYEEWTEMFIRPVVQKACNLVTSGGRVVIFAANYTDVVSRKVVPFAADILGLMPDFMAFEGSLQFEREKRLASRQWGFIFKCKQ